MSNDAAHVIGAAVAEVQALLYDHYRCNKHTSAEVVAKINRTLYESTVIFAMYDLGYIPAFSPPEANYTLPAGLE